MAHGAISRKKQMIIGQLVITGNINIHQNAKKLKISRNTMKKYIKVYQPYIDLYPDAMVDKALFLSVTKPPSSTTLAQEQLNFVLPEIMKQVDGKWPTKRDAWLNYLKLHPDGYKSSTFYKIIDEWFKERKIVPRLSWQVQNIPDEDFKILKQWRRSHDRRKWERAVVILESYQNKPSLEIAKKVDRSVDRIRVWINGYKSGGMLALEKPNYRINPDVSKLREEKRENLIRLIHETPKLHGINRASWFLEDLSKVYQRVYGTYMCTSTISVYLRKEGYVYRKAREVLTSPDPNFREKMDRIKNILENLSPTEKFFSVDEFGPFAVKIKGGRSLVKRNERKTFPQIQKSKGFTICTAALELSSNQITHFFSQKKDTDEMINLIEMLLIRYTGHSKLYFSWDAASWHASKKLNNYVDSINCDSYRQENNTAAVELAPLPASAQFLNVIESVFSGLAKSIIHNSDYVSLDECKAAITKYFKTRNEHFIANPHRAGNKIWGNERVSPVFKDTNNCKDPKYR